MCNAVKLPSAPRLKFQNPGQNYLKSEEAEIKILLDNDPQTKITGIMYFNVEDFENWNQLEIEVGHLLKKYQKLVGKTYLWFCLNRNYCLFE